MLAIENERTRNVLHALLHTFKSDAEIARDYGISRQRVGYVRHAYKIPKRTERYTKINPRWAEFLADDNWIHKTDQQWADYTGIPLLLFQAMRREAKKMRPNSHKRIDWDNAPLGKMTDAAVADLLGCNSITVLKARNLRKIPSFRSKIFKKNIQNNG